MRTGAYVRVGTENIDIAEMTDEQLEAFTIKLSQEDAHIRMVGWIQYLARWIRDNVNWDDAG